MASRQTQIGFNDALQHLCIIVNKIEPYLPRYTLLKPGCLFKFGLYTRIIIGWAVRCTTRWSPWWWRCGSTTCSAWTTVSSKKWQWVPREENNTKIGVELQITVQSVHFLCRISWTYQFFILLHFRKSTSKESVLIRLAVLLSVTLSEVIRRRGGAGGSLLLSRVRASASDASFM